MENPTSFGGTQVVPPFLIWVFVTEVTPSFCSTDVGGRKGLIFVPRAVGGTTHFREPNMLPFSTLWSYCKTRNLVLLGHGY
jgi:hypothetical protein